MGILAKGGKVWLLTGTPMLNQPMELWQLLSIANVQWKTFGSWGNFISLFGGSKKYWGGYDFVSEAMNETEIKKCIAPYILRRTKDETLKDLPSKSHQIHKVSVSRDLHKFHPDEAVQAKSPEDIQGISEISSFRKILAMEKLKASMDLIESYEASGESIVVFSAHLGPIDFLMKREVWTGITGETINSHRERAVKDFQSGFKIGFAGTIQAAGVGITLTRASNVIFIDKAWTPALNRQAEDRLHRIGQKNALIVHHIESDHMLCYHVNRVLGYKSEMIDRIF
jgi:SNF2 family DNA or RNA helicase